MAVSEGAGWCTGRDAIGRNCRAERAPILPAESLATE